MQNAPHQQSSIQVALLAALMAVSLSSVALVNAAMPFNSATVTRVENKVNYGQVSGGRSNTRLASPQDVVKSSDYLLTETDSRAELRYQDGSLVRVGQNTVFSFDADNRTLKLEKGTFIFYVPKGSGGATIKTPSITAAVTGTTCAVSTNMIAVIEGEVVILPGRERVGKFQFARRNMDGSLTIGFFEPTKVFDGKLFAFNGPIPGLPEIAPGTEFRPPSTIDDSLSRGTHLPGRLGELNPQPANRESTITVLPPPPESTPSTSPY